MTVTLIPSPYYTTTSAGSQPTIFFFLNLRRMVDMCGSCVYNEGMNEGRPAKNSPKGKHLIVVEAYNPCRCHTLIRARVKIDEGHWFFFFVPNRHGVTFGDHLVFYTDDQVPPTMNLYLDRGKGLQFRLKMDDVPRGILDKALRELSGLVNPQQDEKGENNV